MTTCDCTSTNLTIELVLKLDRFDFAPVLRKLLSAAGTVSVGGFQPLAVPGLASFALDHALLGAWPYVAEMLSIYDLAVTAEIYVGTSSERTTGLIDILGYQPRPAVSVHGTVSAHMAGSQHREIRDIALRSAPAPGVAPQVVELLSPKGASHSLNSLRIAPLRELAVQDVLFLDSSTAAPIRGLPVLFMWKGPELNLEATEILSVRSVGGVDREAYVAITVTKPPGIAGDVDWESVSLHSTSQRAFVMTKLFDGQSLAVEVSAGDISGEEETYRDPLTLFLGGHIGSNKAAVPPLPKQTTSTVDLDGSYRSIVTGDVVIFQRGAEYHARRVVETSETPRALTIGDTVVVPVTQLKLSPALPEDFVTLDTQQQLVIHYNLHDIGRLTRPAKHILTPDDLVTGAEIPLEGIYDRPPPGFEPKQLILQDANGAGVLVDGTINFDDKGGATMTLTGGTWDSKTMLRVPVTVHGNVLPVSVGETVRDELLGDGDPSIAYQSFDLKKTPLTYLVAPGSERGYVSTLEVRVGGVLWAERPTFYGAGPTDRVYTVRHDEDGATTITFGDGIRGARLPTGSGNVRATYRFGAGAASIPAGSITQIVRGAPGLVRVRSPAPLTGGSERESAAELRQNGPASALILGRLISLPDFAARAQSFAGVLQSKVERAWDKQALSAVVKVWFIPNEAGGEEQLARALTRDLEALSEEGTIVEATPAKAKPDRLRVAVVVDPAYRPEDVTTAVFDVLADPKTGILAKANARIGGVLMRAELAAAIRSVAGVLDIDSIARSSGLFPAPGIRAPRGCYYDFLGPNGSQTMIIPLDPELRPCTSFGS